MYSNKENVNILTGLLVEHGVRHVVVCPGSRNAPLVHNFNEHPSIECHPVTDERSAGFVALGLALEDRGSIVAVCVTSGSALLNVLPAVAEATYQRCGIVVISADRPECWVDQLDGQTLPQPTALGKFVAKSVQLPEPADEEGRWYCGRLVNEAFVALRRTRRSVHINVPIPEPLFDFTAQSISRYGAVQYLDWRSVDSRTQLCDFMTGAQRPMIVIGQLPPGGVDADTMDRIRESVIVLFEPLSIGGAQKSMTDQMLYAMEDGAEEYIPDAVLYVGGHTVSKRLRQFLRSLPASTAVAMVDEEGELHDVSRHAKMVVHGAASDVMKEVETAFMQENVAEKDTAYYKAWNSLYQDTVQRHDAFVPSYSSMKAVYLLEKAYADACVHYANSMSVRLGAIYADGFYRYCNRGVNGIEGSLSTAAGASLTHDGNVFCVIGDLSFFYDENALWQQQLSGNLRVLLLNNGGGVIFRNLKGLETSSAREPLVAASHPLKAEGVCRQFGLTYRAVASDMALEDAIEWLGSVKSERPVVLEVLTTPEDDAKVYSEYYKSLKNK